VVAERWKNIDEIKSVRSPLLVIHGKLDTLIPHTMAIALHKACPTKRKTLVLPENSDHNTFNLYNDILRPVAAFIRSHCRAAAGEVAWAKKVTAARGKVNSRLAAAKIEKPMAKPPAPPQEAAPDQPEQKQGTIVDLEPVALLLPKFLQDVPFYAWEMHPDCKAIMARLRKANMRHNVKPVYRPGNSQVPSSSSASRPAKVGFTAASPALNTGGLREHGAIPGASLRRISGEIAAESKLPEFMRKLRDAENAAAATANAARNAKSSVSPSRNQPTGIGAVDKPVVDIGSDKKHGKGSEEDSKRILGDVEVLELVESLEKMMLCGLIGKAAGLEPPSFWPVVVDATRTCSRSPESSLSDFVTDVRYVASQDLERSDAHCSLGRAWLKHLLTVNRLHATLGVLNSMRLPGEKTPSDAASNLKITNAAPRLMITKWYGKDAVMGKGGVVKERLMRMARIVDAIEMALQLD